jgi:SAM-dependent methyltransferase
MTPTGTDTEASRQRAEAQWLQALLEGASDDPASHLAAELAAYTKEPLEVVLERMRCGTEAFAALWHQRSVDPADPQSLHDFYNAGLTEAYELLHWHAGGLGRCPIQHVLGAWLARAAGARRVLDYGSGVGSAAILLAGMGFDVGLADISRPLLDFSRARLQRRGIEASYHLLPEQRPPASSYDLALCIDVLEHVADPAATVDEIGSYLRVGGLLVATLYEDSAHQDRPMHISSCGPIARFAQRTSLWIDWSLTEQIRQWGGWSVVLRRVPAGRCLRAVERAAGRVLPRPAAALGSVLKRALEAVLPLPRSTPPDDQRT